MYLRTTSRRNADGSTVRYVALAHNHRVEGRTQAQVLLNLGREDRLDHDGLRRLVGSINRYLGEGDGGTDALSETGTGGDVVAAAGLRLVESRPMGTVWLLDGLWKALGWTAPCARCSALAGSPPTWSGCCSRWSPTARWTRVRSGRGRVGQL